jgi:hypothetical protein
VEPWTYLRRPLFSTSIFEFKYLINQASRLSQFGRAPSSKKIFLTFIPLQSNPSMPIVALP